MSGLLRRGATPFKPTVFAGIETAGIPYAAAMAVRSGKKFFYVRRKPQGHGLMSSVAGLPPHAKDRICLVDDGIGSGDTLIVAVKNLLKEGFKTRVIVGVMDLGNHAKIKKRLRAFGVQYRFIVTYQEWAEWMVAHKIMSPGRYDVSMDFIQDPLSWADNKKSKWTWLKTLKQKKNYWFRGPR